MKRFLTVVVLSLTIWLAHGSEADACRFRWSVGFWWGSWCGPYWGWSYPVYSYWGCGPYWGYSPWVYYGPTYWPVVYPRGYTIVVPVASGQAVERERLVAGAAASVNRPAEPSRAAPPVVLTGSGGTKAARDIPANRAKVVVHLPKDARFYVEDRLVKTTEGRREFLTPVLEPGANYRYTFKVEVERDGKTEVQVREVRVRAGHETVVHFDLPDPTVRVASSK